MHTLLPLPSTHNVAMTFLMSKNDAIAQRDLRHVWHPCTQMQDHESLPLIPVRRGQGVWLEDFDGKRYLDAVSSWWVFMRTTVLPLPKLP